MSCEDLTDCEEEILVFAEFEDSVNIENYRSVHILGINEKNPILQMDETIFTGQLENTLGTYMFFAKDLTPQSTDYLFDKLPKETVKYLCKSNKYLNMKHTYITAKDGTEQGVTAHLQPGENGPVPISFKTMQEAIEKFQSDWESIMQEKDNKLIKDIQPSDHDMIDLSSKS